ncbi:MAG: hypothetical protein BWX83_01294 [Candidatus Cloacimonetes bacterium ADurb.Bin117]|nr:MAG: hypothetical protein BWX83_01294 [Candidatus Cloacimonetes bacterium ADurb.Bin117]
MERHRPEDGNLLSNRSGRASGRRHLFAHILPFPAGYMGDKPSLDLAAGPAAELVSHGKDHTGPDSRRELSEPGTPPFLQMDPRRRRKRLYQFWRLQPVSNPAGDGREHPLRRLAAAGRLAAPGPLAALHPRLPEAPGQASGPGNRSLLQGLRQPSPTGF